jgi:uncharacterized protein
MRVRLLLSFVAVVLALAEPAWAAGATATGPRPRATEPRPETRIDPQRFGQKPPDAAFGAFQRGLYKTAFDLALPRAKDDDPAAQTLVAEIYARGLGIRRNATEAANWYERAAEKGMPEAEFQYALILLDGEFRPKDETRAFELMKRAADGGSRFAQFNYAQLVIEREPGPTGLAKAVSYYERAAEAGLADAQYAMSQVYANGVGGKRLDAVEARRWLSRAARQNYDTAQLDLATWLVEGKGGPRDETAGFRLMLVAATAGNVAAQNRLAKLYVNGIGTEGNPVEAAAWYILARRAGLNDPDMDDFLQGLTDAEQKKALERANRLK